MGGRREGDYAINLFLLQEWGKWCVIPQSINAHFRVHVCTFNRSWFPLNKWKGKALPWPIGPLLLALYIAAAAWGIISHVICMLVCALVNIGFYVFFWHATST
jgi:hypothetical protein